MTVSVPRHVGAYSIERKLGIGGMGVVAYGRHQFLGREAAIKLRMRGANAQYGLPGTDDPLLDERFRQGARLQGHCEHPQICRLFDYLESDGWQALVMEYLPGGTIEDALREAGGPLPIPFAIEVALYASQALAFIHKKGIVHRDVKPGNLMLRERTDPQSVKLTDFGIAKCVDCDPGLTVDGANVGTLWYMAPEQFNGEAATPLADVYSLGATLYEMLTGHIPFKQADSAEIFRRFVDGEPPPPLRELNPNVAPMLAALVEAALALNVEERLPSAEAMGCMLWMLRRKSRVDPEERAWRAYFQSSEGRNLRSGIDNQLTLSSVGWSQMFDEVERDIDALKRSPSMSIAPVQRPLSMPLPRLPRPPTRSLPPLSVPPPAQSLSGEGDPGDTLETSSAALGLQAFEGEPSRSGAAFKPLRSVSENVQLRAKLEERLHQQELHDQLQSSVEARDPLVLCDNNDLGDRSIHVGDFIMPGELSLNAARNSGSDK